MARAEVEITIVLDRSGSMASIWDDTVGGFNALIEDQRRIEAGDVVRVSLLAFNQTVEPIFTRIPLAEVPPLTRTSYVPGGSTALLDAVGDAVTALRGRIDAGAVDQAMVVIITDGMENASREWARRREEIARRVKGLEAEGVEFIFLGANIDAFGEGASLGMAVDSSYAFVSSAQGIKGAYGTISARMTSTRTGQSNPEALARAARLARGEIDAPNVQASARAEPKQKDEGARGAPREESPSAFFKRLKRWGRRGR